MGENGLLLFFVILGVFSIATFNVTGVTVTKYINALARSICDVTRTVIVWIVGIIITVSAGANRPNYKWELIDGAAITIQLLGFFVLIAGNLIYNKILKIPFLMPKEEASIFVINRPTSQRRRRINKKWALSSYGKLIICQIAHHKSILFKISLIFFAMIDAIYITW
jgi:hypothetical protein